MSIRVAALALGAILLAGCSGGESAPAETKESQAKAQEAASNWTPEMKEKFKAAKAAPENNSDSAAAEKPDLSNKNSKK